MWPGPAANVEGLFVGAAQCSIVVWRFHLTGLGQLQGCHHCLLPLPPMARTRAQSWAHPKSGVSKKKRCRCVHDVEKTKLLLTPVLAEV